MLKYDDGKVRLELIDPEFIEGVGKVLTFGAGKYEPDNWKKGTSVDEKKIQGSLYRHLTAYMKGEVIDAESGLSHLYHIGCNAMFLAYYERHRTEHKGQMSIRLDGFEPVSIADCHEATSDSLEEEAFENAEN